MFKTKNSWDNITFANWTKREDKSGKTRFDLIPIPELKRVADLYTRGAEIYWDRNWEGGDLEYAEKAKAFMYGYNVLPETDVKKDKPLTSIIQFTTVLAQIGSVLATLAILNR